MSPDDGRQDKRTSPAADRESSGWQGVYQPCKGQTGPAAVYQPGSGPGEFRPRSGPDGKDRWV